MRLRDFIRELFDKFADPGVLRGQLTGRGGKERRWLELQRFDLGGRTLLSGFQAPEGAAERLAQKVAGPEFWVQTLARNDKVKPPARRHAKLSLKFDVVGHERVEPKAPDPHEKVISPLEKAGKNMPKHKERRRKPKAKG